MFDGDDRHRKVPRSPRHSWSNSLLVIAVSGLLQTNVIGTAVVQNCNNFPPARLLNISLERCLQRCRDDVTGSCQWIAWRASLEGVLDGRRCAIAVNVQGCGPGWTVHSVPSTISTCTYGYGQAVFGALCSQCSPGKASHADVGDLFGTWDMEIEGIEKRGLIVITPSGHTYVQDPALGGLVGQFQLWHARADMQYPGAFFFEHHLKDNTTTAPVSTGTWQGWDYAWLEDDSTGLRLVLRRFCGYRHPVCQSARLSPEGSPFFLGSQIGHKRDSESVGVCPFLAAASLDEVGKGCCDAAIAVKMAQDDAHIVATIEGGTSGLPLTKWENVPLVSSTWNMAPPYTSLRDSTLMVNSADPGLCDEAKAKQAVVQRAPVVFFAWRGNCTFLKKAQVAKAAGASGVMIVNTADGMPELITPPVGEERTNPEIPLWLLTNPQGTPILYNVQMKGGILRGVGKRIMLNPASDANLGRLCCLPSCRARAERGLTQGLNGGLDIPSACAAVVCTKYVEPPPPPPKPQVQVLPAAMRPACMVCPEGTVAEGTGYASCNTCADSLVPNAARTSCISSATTTENPFVQMPPMWQTPTSLEDVAPTQSTSSDPFAHDANFNWAAFFGILCCVLIFCSIGYFLKRLMQGSQSSGSSLSEVCKSAFHRSRTTTSDDVSGDTADASGVNESLVEEPPPGKVRGLLNRVRRPNRTRADSGQSVHSSVASSEGVGSRSVDAELGGRTNMLPPTDEDPHEDYLDAEIAGAEQEAVELEAVEVEGLTGEAECAVDTDRVEDEQASSVKRKSWVASWKGKE